MKINFDEIELQLKENDKIDIIAVTTVELEQDKHAFQFRCGQEINFENIIECTFHNSVSETLNFQGLKMEAEKKQVKLNGKYLRYCIFGCQLYNSRYLMIYDLFDSSRKRGLNIIINFDFKTKKWTILDNIWPINQALGYKSYTIIESKQNSPLLQTMGGLIPNERRNEVSRPTRHHFGLKLCRNLDWSIERLLWIAHLKNNSNYNYNCNYNSVKQSSCGLSTLPKDIILLILNFFPSGFVFNTSKI